ncbi:maleylpyruvate isomerase family mycothiol-dependent enzyme [Actinokineospora soli]|uniref:Maleylpyruvate isomerase family mycothiol-dependent enzyme n=1 Tax=Actinokineospora soli TaxID=1048753 RepID=A0ABW2TGH8_9PSEU
MVAPAFTRELSVDWYVAEFRAEVARFADAVGLLPNTDPVVTCPGWTAADLVRHIRQGHEWAASILESRSPTFLPPAGITEDGGSWTEQVAAVGSSASCTPTDIVHYLAEGSQRLAAAIASVPEGTEIWAPHSPTEFWPRWALFETTVHRGDVCLALGHPYALHRTVALDCIDFCLIGFGQPGARPFLNPAFAEIPAAAKPSASPPKPAAGSSPAPRPASPSSATPTAQPTSPRPPPRGAAAARQIPHQPRPPRGDRLRRPRPPRLLAGPRDLVKNEAGGRGICPATCGNATSGAPEGSDLRRRWLRQSAPRQAPRAARTEQSGEELSPGCGGMTGGHPLGPRIQLRGNDGTLSDDYRIAAFVSDQPGAHE